MPESDPSSGFDQLCLNGAPGQSGTITVTITPAGSIGATTGGVLYIDDFNAFAQTGAEPTALPCTYTTGYM